MSGPVQPDSMTLFICVNLGLRTNVRMSKVRMSKVRKIKYVGLMFVRIKYVGYKVRKEKVRHGQTGYPIDSD